MLIERFTLKAQDAIETAVERALKAPDADATDVHRWVYAEGDDPRGTGQAGLFGAGAVGEAVQA